MYDKLRKIFSEEQVTSDGDELDKFNYDSSMFKGKASFLVRPYNSKQIQELVALANRYNFSITIRGSGTSFTGASTPINSVVVDMSSFNKIKLVNTKDKWAEIEPFVTVDNLNDILSSRNLFFPVLPLSHSVASIGGMVATNAGGSITYRYGRTSDWILGLEYIDGSGKIFYINENNSYKDYVGSEGCFGIITRIRVKLEAKIKKQTLYYDTFLSANEMLKTVKILEEGDYGNDIVGIDFISKSASDDGKYHLFVQFDASDYDNTHDTHIKDSFKDRFNNNITKIKRFLGYQIDNVSGPYPWNYSGFEDIEKIRSIEKRCGLRLTQKKYNIMTDPFVPRKKAYHFIKFCETNGIMLFGRLGQGIYYPRFRSDQQNLIEKMYEFVFEHDGKITGEHGIGIEKRDYLSEEEKISFCDKKYKHDYNNILNTDKFVSSVYFEKFKQEKDFAREKELMKSKGL